MEIRVKGSRPEGTYPVHLSFVGRNYCDYPVFLIIVIDDGTEPADAGGDTATDAGDGAIGDGG